jgi:hypothetical protein
MDVLLPGLAPAQALLFDERSQPDFRQVFGMLAGRADEIATAVTRVRLTTVDLTSQELREVTSFRVLVTELSALRLDSEARGIENDPRRAVNVALLSGMLESGRLEVRSAPLGGWSPDFTVFGSAGVPFAVLCGFHWFERPYPHRGPALTAVHFGDAARLAAKRHEEVWHSAHDVGPAVWSILARARAAARAVVSG